MKIVILDAYSIIYKDLSFEFAKDYDVEIYDFTNYEDIVGRISDADIVFTSKCEIDKNIIDACPNLKYIVEMATGYNNIDVAYCRQKNIIVSNVPSYASENVSEMVFAFLLDTFYNIRDYDIAVKNGEWSNSNIFTLYKHLTYTLSGKTIGIIGYGDTAKAVEKKAAAFNMKVLINRKNINLQDEKFVSLDYLFKNSDIVSLHIPLNSETQNIINEESISKMKDKVVFINTSRGGLVDEKALFDALNSGKISRACVDVVSKEPIDRNNILLKAPNITITPHIAWAAKETRQELLDILNKNLKSYISGKAINIVN